MLTNYARLKDPPLLARHLTGEGELADLACLGSGQPSATRSADGRFWFPTTRGVVSFDPATLPREHPPLTVLLEEVWVDGVAHFEISNLKSQISALRVPSAARRLEFRYTSPEMVSPERLRFRHRLAGLEKEWVDAGSQRVAHYGHLPPGRYQFQVMAGMQDAWQLANRPFSIEVVPRLWERAGFQLAGVLTGLVLVGLAVRTLERGRARRRLARLETQQAMERERARIAQDLHDDLGTGLTEIMLLGELAAREETPAAERRRQVAAITEKSRQLAVAMDETVWTVNPKNDWLPNLASYLADFAREFFGSTPIRCRMDLADNLPRVALSAAQRHNLFLATKEALNNVARHSGASEVWLRLRLEAGQLELVVEDNGRGFEVSKLKAQIPDGGGNGLPNMGARLEALGGRAEIESQPGRGTTVRFVARLSGEPQSA
jgi:signal transduction histidine kinase